MSVQSARKTPPSAAADEIDAAEPRIVDEEKVRLVPADVAAAVALQPVHVQAAAVQVDGEELVRDTVSGQLSPW